MLLVNINTYKGSISTPEDVIIRSGGNEIPVVRYVKLVSGADSTVGLKIGGVEILTVSGGSTLEYEFTAFAGDRGDDVAITFTGTDPGEYLVTVEGYN